MASLEEELGLDMVMQDGLDPVHSFGQGGGKGPMVKMESQAPQQDGGDGGTKVCVSGSLGHPNCNPSIRIPALVEVHCFGHDLPWNPQTLVCKFS
jgi:hypothetical protein